MARLLPFRRSELSLEPRRPRLVELDDDSADAVFAALSTETARDILGRLYEDPGTATDVAEAADTSLQNARYHLEKLQAAGLVEAVDTWYSSRGTEMTVYAPTNEPLVVAAGPEEQTSVLRSALSRLVGALGVLGLASLFVDWLARSGLGGLSLFGGTGSADSGGGEPEVMSGNGGAGGDAGPAEADAATSTPTSTPSENATTVLEATEAVSPTPSPTPTPTAAPDVAVLDPGLPPGLLFFLGGLLVLAAVAGWWYWRRYRPLYG